MNTRFWKSMAALLLVLILCASFGCAKRNDAKKIAGYVLETNEERSGKTYPYVIHTPHATWYLAAADIEKMGEEAFFAGLETMLTNQEADFADAYAVLDGYLVDEIAPIDIHTDFAAQTERAKWNKAGAYYLGPDLGIYLYLDWNVAGYALLHEYAHYLTMECCTFDLKKDGGFWAEGIAEYLSMLVCQNRMGRSVQFGFGDAALAEVEWRGLLDADGTLNPQKFYCFMAAYMRSGAAIGETYSAVSETPITQTEQLLEHPMLTTISYYEGGCFFQWLVDRYGKDQVFAHMTIGQEDFPEAFGQDFETLFFAWAEDNNAWCVTNGIVLGPPEE